MFEYQVFSIKVEGNLRSLDKSQSEFLSTKGGNMIRILVLIIAFLFGSGVALADFKTVASQAEKAGWKVKNYGRTFSLGLKKYGKMRKVPMAKFKAAKAVPSSYDWRTTGMVTPVRDQGNCGSCWAFSSVGVLESANKIKGNNTADLDLSEQIVVSCDTGNQGCSGGYMDAVSDFLKASGTGLESCYPYTATDGSCSKACADKSAYKVASWGYVATVSPDVESIKAALVTYGPLVTTMMVYSDFMYYSSGIYKYTSGQLEGGHAIILVGYDDSTQAFTVKNSWGTGWGESGFFRIAYSEISSRVLFGEETIYYTVEATPPTPPTPPSPGCNTSVGKSGANAITSWWSWLMQKIK
jgi:C1A family cysteine protease